MVETQTQKRRSKSMVTDVHVHAAATVCLLVGSFLFVVPDATAAMVPVFTEQQQQITRPVDLLTTAAKVVTTRTTPPSFSMVSLSEIFVSIADDDVNPNELRIQQKYLDLAGELKEEVKFRANQGKEKIEEETQKARERSENAVVAAAAERDAKLKAFDDKFDDMERERNESYRSKIISRDSYIEHRKEQESTEDRSAYTLMMQALSPDATSVERLKYQLDRDTTEEKQLKSALAGVTGRPKGDPDADETKTAEQTILKINIKKAKQETAKLRKDIALQESLEVIKAQRAAEIKVYQDRADINEKEKQEKIEAIRLAKKQQQVAFEEKQARKKLELQELKFANQQILYERQFDDLDRFEKRKSILVDDQKKQQTKALVNDVDQLPVDGSGTNVEKDLQP